jgi:hypothetical protein
MSIMQEREREFVAGVVLFVRRDKVLFDLDERRRRGLDWKNSAHVEQVLFVAEHFSFLSHSFMSNKVLN